jgi:hypothetical protein
MKKVLPFVFPLVALIIVVFLAYRWYNLNTANRTGQINDVGEGVEIEDLSEAERNNIVRGVGDFKQVELKTAPGNDEAAGGIRYEVKDGKVRFSVTADLPTIAGGRYQVWIKSGDQPTQKAFILEATKGGYLGSAAVSATELPLEITVTREMTDDDTMESTILLGNIPREG